MAPRPGGGITSAETEHLTPHGRAAVSWRLDGDELLVEVTVPGGCTAEVELPDGSGHELGPGVHGLSSH